MSPACLVRCVAANGYECVELAGQNCHGCEQGLSDHNHSSPTCCSACSTHRDSDDHDDAETTLTSRENCGCSHSPLDFGPQTSTKSLTAERLLNDTSIWSTALPSRSRNLAEREREGHPLPPARGQISLHLTVLATVVLRA